MKRILVVLTLAICNMTTPAAAQTFFVDNTPSMDDPPPIDTPAEVHIKKIEFLYALMHQLLSNWPLQTQQAQVVWWNHGIANPMIESISVLAKEFETVTIKHSGIQTRLSASLDQYWRKYQPLCQHIVVVTDMTPHDFADFARVLPQYLEHNSLTVVLVPNVHAATSMTRFQGYRHPNYYVMLYDLTIEPILAHMRLVDEIRRGTCYVS